MKRFFFHVQLSDGSLMKDEEGRDFVDDTAAENEALRSAREIIGVAVRYNTPMNSDRLLAMTTQGEIAFSIDLNVCDKIRDLIKIERLSQI